MTDWGGRAAAPVATAADGERDRLDQITGAANRLLKEGGLDALTIRALLQRTGLARRAFYDAFAGKDELVLAVFERTVADAVRLLRRELAAMASPLARLEAIVTGIVLGQYSRFARAGEGVDRRSVALSREHLRLAEARPRELAAVLRPLVTFIAEEIETGIREGLLREADPAVQAMLIYNLVATTTHSELLGSQQGCARRRREQLADAMWSFCRRAIER